MSTELEKDVETTVDYRTDDLNWRDDETYTDATNRNDYFEGYKQDPYQFSQWAKNDQNQMTKVAMQTVTPVQYDPVGLAQYIITTWQQVDGQLQDFFDGFTLRYNNELKQSIANELGKLGYTVYPVLVDDRPMYASRLNAVLKIARKKPYKTKLRVCKAMFPHSEPLQLCLGEISDTEEIGRPVSEVDVTELLNYYSQIFPKDYSIALTTDLVNNKPVTIKEEHYQDFNLSDKCVSEIEKIMTGNQDPWYSMHDGGKDGWDYVSDLRSMDGTAPGNYEIDSRLNYANITSKKKQ